MKRVGHKGADLIVPGNTRASFDAAIACGVDMVEFDVLPARDGTLVLAHDGHALARGDCETLEEGLEHLKETDVELDVDLKLPGYEARVVEALERHGVVERCLVTSQYRASLDRVRALEPELRVGWSVPRARRDYTKSRAWAVPALGLLAAYRATLPRNAARAIRAGRFDAVMAFWRLVTPALVSAVHGAGGELYVWTVDDPARIAGFRAMGVTGVITNDPRLFTGTA